MPSVALQDYESRLSEVQQLVDAHGAVVRLKKAEEAHAEDESTRGSKEASRRDGKGVMVMPF